MPHDTTLAVEQGADPAPPRVEVDGSRFRVRTAQLSTQWLPDTPSNRHLTLVWCRLLVDAHGKPLFTLQELAVIVGSTNRQAASQHLEDFRQCGEDMRAFVLRKRKVDPTVVEGVLHELLQTPLAGPTELGPRVQARLGRDDLTVANIACALEQISCVPVLRTLRRQLDTGQVHYQEAWLLTELLGNLSLPAPRLAGWNGPSTDRGMQLADPTALAALVTPDLPLAQVPGSLCWLTFLMTLFYWNVPLSVLGRWCGVHKTTILRWVLGLALALGRFSPDGLGSESRRRWSLWMRSGSRSVGAGTIGSSSWMCPPSCRCWRPSSRRAGSGPVAGWAGKCASAKKCPRCSSPMGYRRMRPWRREPSTSCVAFTTSRA